MNQHDLARGIALSVAASTLFALMSGYTKWLAPLDGLDIFAWRIVWTLPGALALVAVRKRWPQLCALVSKLAKTPHLLLAFAVVAALLAVQLWTSDEPDKFTGEVVAVLTPLQESGGSQAAKQTRVDQSALPRLGPATAARHLWAV